jgi:hypothetical protein
MPDLVRFADLEFEKGTLPDDWMALEAVIALKGVSGTDGSVELFCTATKGLTSWEAIGMLECAIDDLRAAMRGSDG